MMHALRTSDATRSSRCIARALVALLAWCVLTRPRMVPAANRPTEYQLKAALILNFARFIEWPHGTFPNSNAPIKLGVLGEDPFGSVLEQTFQNETAQGRRLVVERSHQVEDLRDCQMLFVSRSERDRVAGILADLDDAPIVTIGEIDQFALRGGIINFYNEQHKIRFEINPSAAERKGLKISSQLLKRARIIGPNPADQKR